MKPLRPLTPHELRDATIRDYKRSAERSGGRVDLRTIERLALSDLALADAYDRDAKRLATTKKRAPEKKQRPDVLGQHLERHGLRERHREVTGPDLPRSFMDLNPFQVSQRWPYATARIMRILQPRDDVKMAALKGLEEVVRAASYPALAKAYIELWCWFLMRGKRSKWNPFYGLSDSDAAKKFIRGVEDICDKSTGVLGSWYVK